MQEEKNSAIATGAFLLTEFPSVQYRLGHDDRTSYKWRNLKYWSIGMQNTFAYYIG